MTFLTPHVHHVDARSFVSIVIMWTGMMIAMMTPAVLPWLATFAKLTRDAGGRWAVPAFASGYAAIWLAYSVAAALVQWLLQEAGLPGIRGPAAGALLMGAGLFQFAPIKRACLTHCRNPLTYFLLRWRNGPSGGFRLGAAHGTFCVGCCWALMAIGLVTGLMNMAWMAVVAAIVWIEQLVPHGDRIGRGLGVAMAGWGLVLLLSAGAGAIAQGHAAPGADSDWPINGGRDNIRYSRLTQINRSNVGRLEVAWTYDSHDAFKASEMQSNPVVVDGVLYATTPTLKVIALDAETGRELWKFDPSGGGATSRFRHRGVTVHDDRVLVTYRSFLWALDKRTGQPIRSFGTDGRIDLREGLDRPAEGLAVSASTPGAIFEDTIILGSSVPETLPGSPGHIRAFDVKTGKRRWIFHTIPQPGEFGYATWPPDAYKLSGGANAWAGVTVDPRLAMVFAATGSASFDFYGVTRQGSPSPTGRA